MNLPAQLRRTDCVTDLALDRLFTNELDANRRKALEAHFVECADCRARRDAMLHERTAYLDRHPEFVPAKSRPGKVVALTTALAAAAAVVLFLRQPEGTLRTKGSVDIGYFVQRGTTSVLGAPDVPLHPSDRVRFTYSSEGPTHLAIYSFDAHRTASTFFPAAPTAAELRAGSAVPLPTMVELDDALGTETVTAVFCKASFDVEALRVRLSKNGALDPPDGCQVRTLAWRKEPMPR